MNLKPYSCPTCQSMNGLSLPHCFEEKLQTFVSNTCTCNTITIIKSKFYMKGCIENVILHYTYHFYLQAEVFIQIYALVLDLY